MIKCQRKVLTVFVCLSVIVIDRFLKKGRYYYPPVFLEECKYIVKEEEVTRQITEDL